MAELRLDSRSLPLPMEPVAVPHLRRYRRTISTSAGLGRSRFPFLSPGLVLLISLTRARVCTTGRLGVNLFQL